MKKEDKKKILEKYGLEIVGGGLLCIVGVISILATVIIRLKNGEGYENHNTWNILIACVIFFVGLTIFLLFFSLSKDLIKDKNKNEKIDTLDILDEKIKGNLKEKIVDESLINEVSNIEAKVENNIEND